MSATAEIESAATPSDSNAWMAVPYVRQASDTMCGAASLCMVYGHYCVASSQEVIWKDVTLDGFLARTHLVCQHALKNGLHGLVIQSRDPWQMVQRCASLRIPAILSHRVTWSSLSGHYSVLIGANEEQVVIHDPHAGANRCLSRLDFLDLWSKGGPRSSIAGHVLVALQSKSEAAIACSYCGNTLPSHVDCRDCRRNYALAPAALLQCGSVGCPGRTWKRIYCPHCDSSRRDLVDNTSLWWE